MVAGFIKRKTTIYVVQYSKATEMYYVVPRIVYRDLGDEVMVHNGNVKFARSDPGGSTVARLLSYNKAHVHLTYADAATAATMNNIR